MEKYEIQWDDLTPECQSGLLRFFGTDDPDEVRDCHGVVATLFKENENEDV